MSNTNLSAATIAQVGLTLSTERINAAISPEARVFNYPSLEHVYIMESDLYGNPMPADSCFLAFIGRNGLIGKQITVEMLTGSDAKGIEKLVDSNSQG